MSFSDYKHISQVQQEFNITYCEEHFITPQDVQVPSNFLEEFTFNKEYIDLYTSEGARTELIILPVLREVYKSYAQNYSLWIQKSLIYDEKLSGTPDYIISKRSKLGKTVLEKPLLIIVEAKKNDFDQGWGQCLAELLAVQKLNSEPGFSVYGIVTDGRYWEFGKLENSLFTKNSKSYSIDQLDRLFGVLHFIFQAIGINKESKTALI